MVSYLSDEPKRHLADSLVRIVLQNQLLQPQKRPLMRDLLPDLHTRLPRILRSQPRTARALTRMHHQRQLEGLLQDGIGENFFLDSDFELHSARMWFCPDESGVNESDFHKWPSDLLQADSY